MAARGSPRVRFPHAQRGGGRARHDHQQHRHIWTGRPPAAPAAPAAWLSPSSSTRTGRRPPLRHRGAPERGITGETISLRRSLVQIWYGPGEAQYFKGSSPCMLAYARDHRPQEPGRLPVPCGPTIVHVRHSFAPGRAGLLHGMLSRVTTREKLKVVAPLTIDSFTPVTHGAGALTANDWTVLRAQLRMQTAAMRARMDHYR